MLKFTQYNNRKILENTSVYIKINTPSKEDFKINTDTSVNKISKVTETDNGFIANGTSTTRPLIGHPINTRFEITYTADPNGKLTIKFMVGTFEHTYTYNSGIKSMAEINVALMSEKGWTKI